MRQSPKEGLRLASLLQFRAVELGCATGEVSPGSLSASGRRHLLRYCDGLGLNVHALTADFSNLRFTDPVTVDERIARTCQTLELAADLGVNVVSTGLGALTNPQTDEPSDHAIQALRTIGEFAESRNVNFALRPSADSTTGVLNVLEALACPSIKIGLDPAAAVMSGVDPMALLQRVIGQVNIVHARDAVTGTSDSTGSEVSFGRGEVDFLGIFSLLHAAEYEGPYVIRRRSGEAPIADIGRAREQLSEHYVGPGR